MAHNSEAHAEVLGRAKVARRGAENRRRNACARGRKRAGYDERKRVRRMRRRMSAE